MSDNSRKELAADLSHYPSHFATNYDPVRLLGAGGFGIVLKAINKLDNIHYAVKRFPLSSSADDKAKVVREVRAHAQLIHQNIVRYNGTWLEAPPPGWQAMADFGLAATVGSSIHDPGWTTTYSDITSGDYVCASGRTGKKEPAEYLYITMELCVSTAHSRTGWTGGLSPRGKWATLSKFLNRFATASATSTARVSSNVT
jgi:serine/threonine protein kinase